MSYLINDITNPIIQIDSVAIGLQLNDKDEAKNLSKIDLKKYEEFLVVGEKTYINDTEDTKNTKWNFIVNDSGVAINTSRNLANDKLTLDTSLFVDKNIHCSGIIKAAGLQFSNIILDNTDLITCNLVKSFITTATQLAATQPFKTSIYSTDYNNIYNNSYKIANLFTPNYVTFGGEVDTYNNTNPLNIVTTPNNKFNNMHISIRNDTNNDYSEPVRMCMGIIGGCNESPAIISTTRGVPLEFHVSKSAENIEESYGNYATPTYINYSNIPAMTIDANHNVGIGTNISTKYIYNIKILQNDKILENLNKEDHAKLDVKGLVAFENILIKDYVTGTYKHTDDIYIRNKGAGVLNATQINEGNFTGSQYFFNNNLTVDNLFTANNVNVTNDIIIQNNTKTGYLYVEEESIFNGDVSFGGNVNFLNMTMLNVKNVNLNVENDIFINNKRVLPLDLTDPTTGYTKVINDDNGSNFIFMYVSSNIAYLDANCNVSFPKKLGLGLNPNDTFDGVLNIIKDDIATSNSFDILLKNTVENKVYVANIGRLARLDYNDNSLIINTNSVVGKKNNIYFYPGVNINALTNNSFLQNTPPTLSLLKGNIGINKINPNAKFALDINGNISANEYYIYGENNYKKTKQFVYNSDKNYFNVYDKICDKFCINYNESGELAINMKGLNVKKGINTDLYYQNNILLETLQRASNDLSFHTNKYISIGWKGEENVAPLQIRNIFTTDYNYSVIRIYRGERGGGKKNNADYSGIDICEYEKDLNSDRNKERWFIYKNHKFCDLDCRDIKRVGPLQIGYTDKTIQPTSYGMSFYYDTEKSKYHIDVNNPKVKYDDDSAMTIYGDLSVHGNINILDNYGCNFNFNLKALSTNLEKVDKYFNYVSSDILNGYNNISSDKIVASFDIFRPKENIIIDPINLNEIPLVVKNINNTTIRRPSTKFITYSKNDISYSSIELAIYNSNFYYFNDTNDMNENVKSSVEISTSYDINNSNTILDFNVLNNANYKNFFRIVNTTDDSGDIINSTTHLGLGDSKNSNILLHIDGSAKYGMQITNTSHPASINLVNSSGGNDIYHSISGGDETNMHKFTIGIDSKNYNNYDPTLKNVFTIDAIENFNLRNGARFGFNEDFNNVNIVNNVNNATLVINSEINNSSVAITNRYSYNHIYNSSVDIAYENVSLSSSYIWNNKNKSYRSYIVQNITDFPEVDTDNNIINTDDSIKEDFVIKEEKILSKILFYTTIINDINYKNYYSNLVTNYNNYYNYQLNTEYVSETSTQSSKSKYNNNFYNNLLEIIPKKIVDNINDDLIVNNNIEEITINNNITHTLSERNLDLEINYIYENKYKKSDVINCNIIINSEPVRVEKINDSNYINISNNIIYTLQPFDPGKYVTELIYSDLRQERIYITDNAMSTLPQYIEYSNLYLKTLTNNIIRYNSNNDYIEKYYSIHSNYLNINSCNLYIEKLIKTNPILSVSSNINGNNVIIKTSNYSINEYADSSITQRNTNLKLIKSTQLLDTFNILGYTCNNILVIEEYINNYTNANSENFRIDIRNYNRKKYYPHISLINDVEKNVNSAKNTHEIYSYDGIFEIKYNDSADNDFTALKIDENKNLHINGGINAGGVLNIGSDLRIAGNIYDALGNNLIEALNRNSFTGKYQINSPNIIFNQSGTNGVEFNITAGKKYNNYKLLNIKDYLSDGVLTDDNEDDVYKDVLVLQTSNNLNKKSYYLDLYSDLYVYCNLHIDGYGNNTSLSIEQKGRANIISASNFNREILTLANDGSLGLGVTDPKSVLMNMRQINSANIISASNFSKEVFTLTNDGILGIGVTNPNKVSKLDVNGNINIVDDTSSGFIYTINNRDIIRDTCNYVERTSNLIGTRITNLSADYIADGTNNRFIIDDKYNSDLYVHGDLTASNLIIHGTITTFNTDIYATEQLDVTNNGQGTAVTIKQIATNNNVFSASNMNSSLFNIKYDGKVGINTDNPIVFLDVNTKDGIKIPCGNTLERPVESILVPGIIRYNTEYEQFEGYGPGSKWGSLGGVKDLNNDTYISAETTPGFNNDELQFFTNTQRNMIIKKDGKIGIGKNISDPEYLLDVSGEIRTTSNLFVNSNIFLNSNLFVNSKISIGTYNTESLLNVYGTAANIKIQDPSNTETSITSIELVNGVNNSFANNKYYGWKMFNSNNNYIISSGSNNLINDRLTINGINGNIGVGTIPNHTLDVYGTLNATKYQIDGKPFVLEFTQGMIIQTIHNTYRETKTKGDNTTAWVAIDDDINNGFIVRIQPSHVSSKVLVTMSCHIGMDYAENSRWWGIQLYRKIGTGPWTLVENANGSNSAALEGTPCWISHNMGADNSQYSHSITNVSGSYEDLPNTIEPVYYTAYWKSKLNNTFGRLYINRPATIDSSYNSNYPLTSSSWTASEIWNNGIPYTPTDATITIAHNKVGIGTVPPQISDIKLDVIGNVRATNITHASDYRLKKNIESITNVLDDVISLNPVSYLTLEQQLTDKKSYGFIAQELNEVFPNIVNEPKNNEDFYSINYTSIIPLLVKSIQELTTKIENIQEEINNLKIIK